MDILFVPKLIHACSERQTNDLWVAVDDSDVVKVKTLLQQGTDPNDPVFWTEEWWSKDCGKSRARRPPLHTACYNGNIEIIQLLLQAGAKVDKSEGQDNRTPFFQACRGGHKDVVDYLIKEFGPTIGRLRAVTPLVAIILVTRL